jgi:hypothetical protein
MVTSGQCAKPVIGVFSLQCRKSRRIMASGDKKSPQLSKIKVKVGNSTVTASDSDASVETNSLSADSTTEQNNVPQTEKRRKKTRRGSEWEIMEGLKDGQRFESKPNQFSGFLHKKRKWPLKGWHKVIFQILHCLSRCIKLDGQNKIFIMLSAFLQFTQYGFLN